MPTAADMFRTASGADNIPPPPPGFVPVDQAPPPPPPGFVPVSQAQSGPAPVTAGGLARSAGSGLLGGLADLASATNIAFGTSSPMSRADIEDTETKIGAWAAHRFGLMTPEQSTQWAAQRTQQRQRTLGPTTQESLQGLGLVHQPQNTAEQWAQTAGAMAPGLLMGPESDLGSIARALPMRALTQVAAPTVGSEAGGAIAQRYAPDLETPARIVGGGLGAAGATTAAGLIEAAGRAAQRSPLAAVVSTGAEGAAGIQAGSALNAAATDAASARAGLANGADVRVPGSTPTIGQQTGDLGLLGQEKMLANKNPPAFLERQGEQAAAQTAAVTGLETGGNPMALATALKSHFDALDTQSAARIEALTAEAKARADVMGGNRTPEGSGNDLREAIVARETAARAQEGDLWKAIDPNRDLTGNMTQTVSASKDIPGQMRPTEKPMDGEEAAIFEEASKLPALGPVADLIALRQRLNAAQAAELAGPGRTPSYARMSQLNGAISDNLATTISHEVANDEAKVQSGALAPNNAIGAKIKAWIDEYRAQQQSAGTGGGGGVAPLQPTTTSADVGPNGAALPPAGGLGGAAGDQGLSAPTFDEAGKARLAAANEATRQRGGTFGIWPVSNITDTVGYKTVFKLPNGAVPDEAFRAGPKGFDAMTRVLAAGGPDAVPILQDYAAVSLRDAAMKADGTLDPNAFARWQARYANALRVLPADTQAKFIDAAAATQAVNDAMVGRAETLKAAQAGALGKLMNSSDPGEVTNRLGNILGQPDAQAQLRDLVARTANDPVAAQGLRRGIVDYILQKFVSNREAGTTEEFALKADAFQTFVRKSQAALGEVFSPSEMETMKGVVDDLQRAKRSVTAAKLPGGSDTGQNMVALFKAAGFTKASALTDVISGAGVGMVSHNPVLGALVGVGAHIVQLMREAGIRNVSDLQTEAVLNPPLARALMQRAAEFNSPRGRIVLANALRRAAKASAIGIATPQRQRK